MGSNRVVDPGNTSRSRLEGVEDAWEWDILITDWECNIIY